jgi:hypothetical protein
MNWELDPDAEPFANSEGLILSLFTGYCKPRDYCASPEQREELERAVELIKGFDAAMRRAGKVEEM